MPRVTAVLPLSPAASSQTREAHDRVRLVALKKSLLKRRRYREAFMADPRAFDRIRPGLSALPPGPRNDALRAFVRAPDGPIRVEPECLAAALVVARRDCWLALHADEAPPMLASRHVPRPATYGYRFVGEILADSGVDLSKADACRDVMIEALGVEPDCDWFNARSHAAELREERAREAATQAAIRHLAVIGIVGVLTFAWAGYGFAAEAGADTGSGQIAGVYVIGGLAAFAVGVAGQLIERAMRRRRSAR